MENWTSRNSFEYVIFFSLPITCYPSLFVAKFFLERSKDKAIDRLPDIGDEPDRLKIPVLVIVAEVIGVDFFVEEKDSLGEQVLPKPFGVRRKGALVDPEDHEPDMTEYDLLCFRLTTPLGKPDKAAFFLQGDLRISTDNVTVGFPHAGTLLLQTDKKSAKIPVSFREGLSNKHHLVPMITTTNYGGAA